MRLVAAPLLLAPLAGGAPVGQDTPAPAPPLVLVGARVLDPMGEGWLDGRAVRLEDGRIAKVARAEEVETDGATVVDLDGYHLVPGLIDLHSHLLLVPYDRRSWDDQVLRDSLELRTIRGVGAARRTLEAGFTTLRELGTEGAGFADVALRDAIEEGLVVGPRLACTTRALVATGCYGPSGFDPRWDVPKGAQVADGVDGVRRAVREQVAAGADWIKVYADYRRRPGDRSTPTYSQAELDAIVDEATSAGLPVAAHAITDEGARRAVRAGVRTIEHGYEVSPATFELMAERGVVFCPTLAANEAVCRYRGWTPDLPLPPRIGAAMAMMKQAQRAGVTIACGSDVGVFAHGENVRELELLVEYGMTNEEALRAATLVAAETLGRGRELGRVLAGAHADLVVVAGDPLRGVSALREPAMVIARGRIVVDRR